MSPWQNGVRPGAPSGSAAPDHQRFVEQPALVQIAKQRRVRLVEHWQQVFLQPREVIRMRVPAASPEDLERIPEDRDKLSARFYQAARGKARLTEQRHAVALPQRVGFSLHIERIAHLAGRQQRVRGLLVRRKTFDPAVPLQPFVLRVELAE